MSIFCSSTIHPLSIHHFSLVLHPKTFNIHHPLTLISSTIYIYIYSTCIPLLSPFIKPGSTTHAKHHYSQHQRGRLNLKMLTTSNTASINKYQTPNSTQIKRKHSNKKLGSSIPTNTIVPIMPRHIGIC